MLNDGAPGNYLGTSQADQDQTTTERDPDAEVKWDANT
jgi:hypothetical protein